MMNNNIESIFAALLVSLKNADHFDLIEHFDSATGSTNLYHSIKKPHFICNEFANSMANLLEEILNEAYFYKADMQGLENVDMNNDFFRIEIFDAVDEYGQNSYSLGITNARWIKENQNIIEEYYSVRVTSLILNSLCLYGGYYHLGPYNEDELEALKQYFDIATDCANMDENDDYQNFIYEKVDENTNEILYSLSIEPDIFNKLMEGAGLSEPSRNAAANNLPASKPNGYLLN